jgi:hypothetical protein
MKEQDMRLEVKLDISRVWLQVDNLGKWCGVFGG